MFKDGRARSSFIGEKSFCRQLYFSCSGLALIQIAAPFGVGLFVKSTPQLFFWQIAF